MLKKTQRLSRSEFSHFFKTGQKDHTPYFSVIKNTSTLFKGAVVVSKKLYKSAPARNRLKRQTYALLSQKQKELAPLVLIVIYNPKAKDIPRTQLLSKLKDKLDERR